MAKIKGRNRGRRRGLNSSQRGKETCKNLLRKNKRIGLCVTNAVAKKIQN
jgi:hypothetical protein